MAGVPATTADGLQDVISDKRRADPSGKGGTDLLAGFGNLDILRQLGLMVGLMASVAIGFAVVLWSQGDDYQPIYGNMQGYDASIIMEALDTSGTDYRVEPSSGVILVKASELSTIKLRLASAGVARYDGTGYELLDEDQALGTSQYMEANRIKRSQEGELQRTITSFRNIQSTRVHIAIPQRSVFMRSTNKPTASVFLTLNSGANLSDTQIDAIANLVASSIPELHVDDVTIVDQRGNLLSRSDVNLGLELADKQFQYTRKFEQSLIERVRSILSPIVGVDGFQAQVTADIDFTQVEYAAESYDPANQLIRSEQTSEESTLGEDFIGGIPGALANQPPADGVLVDEFTAGTNGLEGQPGNRRLQATRNYELGRKISYTNNDPVSINRVSVAVVLDDRRGVGEEPASAWSEVQINQIATLVKDAVGFSADRGDSVTVINNSFAPINLLAESAVPIWQQSWLHTLLKQAAAGLFILLMVLGVLRPVLANLAKVSPESRQLALAATEGDFSDYALAERALMGDDVRFQGSGDAMLAGPGSEGAYDRQIDQVRGLVAEDPGRVAQVVKKWVSESGQ
ncbi:MAG: flagellar M-ring protein FliF [Pseudohongiellaceae bacterium]|jgi:flagellar M-ring protein FliF